YPEWYSETFASWFSFSATGGYTSYLVDYLIVAGGGGGGGQYQSGGGGGGGVGGGAGGGSTSSCSTLLLLGMENFLTLLFLLGPIER
ncbi:hypothetical protein, partial [Salmonella sp. s60093]|uniref:hypothetical protein n=1 Tax=Salmonella sp. s60093 TaxID=3159721 RepID=UPI00397EF810